MEHISEVAFLLGLFRFGALGSLGRSWTFPKFEQPGPPCWIGMSPMPTRCLSQQPLGETFACNISEIEGESGICFWICVI